MTAEDITSTLSLIGGPIGGASANSGTGLVWGVYQVTCTEDDDYVILPGFEAIYFVDAKAVSSGVFTEEAVTVDTTTTNKIVFHGGGTDVIHMLVIGTPAVETD